MRIIGLLMLAVLVASLPSAGSAEFDKACRREIVGLCGRGESVRACLQARAGQLSAACRAQLRALADRPKRKPRSRPPQDRADTGATTYAYGPDPKQVLDFYPAKAGAHPSPLVVFVHGGGWHRGDKDQSAGSKPGWFTSHGYAFATINYRLQPQVGIADEAQDVANAVAWLRRNALGQGVDPDRIILIGHSAGAHLVALVSTDGRYLGAAKVPMAVVRGAILLDGAAYDVPKSVANAGTVAGDIVAEAFGRYPPAVQKELSPTWNAAAPDVANWLVLYVEHRADSKAQSGELAAALRKAGAHVTLSGVPDATHGSVNRDVGVPGSFVTEQIQAFLRTF